MSARPHLEAFEPRLLYSADALSLAMGLGAGVGAGFHVSLDEAWTQAVSTAASPSTTTTATATVTAATGRGLEIVVVDSSVPDAASLLADLTAQQQAGRQLEVITLNAGDDGIARITALLAQREQISALHLITHGANDLVVLGSSPLSGASLLARADEFAAWGRAFSTDGDLLIYGCDVAAGSSGQRLVSDLAALTGTDVAASTDVTASALRGGNWVLEDQTGRIETALALSAAEQQNYSGSLAAFTVTRFTDDNNPGSLRWAIAQANAASTASTIALEAGTYVMTLNVDTGNSNAGFDFDTERDVTITGAGVDSTFLVAQHPGRHFEVADGTLNLSGLTLRAGSQTNTNENKNESRGGSIYVRSGASLVLSQAVIENSSAENGGAIYVQGTATLTDVELRNNTSRSDGGALYTTGSLTLNRVSVTENTAGRNGGGVYQSGTTAQSLTNVTLSGNRAAQDGGGLYAEGLSLLSSVSVVNNRSDQTGGAAVYAPDNGALVSVVNSLFSGNTDVTGDVLHSNRSLISLGNNFQVGQAGMLTAASDRMVADLKLNALADNGGVGRTHALQYASPAVNAAGSSAPATDQIGTARQGTADVGAYEYINRAPEFYDNVLTIASGGRAIPVLNVADFENNYINLTVMTATRGYFALATNLATSITSFSYEDAYGGKIRFVHDGSAFAPTYTLRASDALNSGPSLAATVYFTPANSAPAASALMLSNGTEDTARTITQAQLLVGITDANGDPLVASNLSLLTAGSGTLSTQLTATAVIGLPNAPITSATGFGVGSGLKGDYYSNKNLTGSPTLTRTEAVDFIWGDGRAATGLPADNFSVNWTGYVAPPTSGNYVFRTESDDGIRVWVNNVLVIDAWSDHKLREDRSSSIALQANTAYTIRVAYFESSGSSTARLQWQTPGSTTFSAVPAASLFADVPTAPPEWVFTPASNWNGTASFSYDVSDGRGGVVNNTASLLIAPVNDAPVIVTNRLTLSEGDIATPQLLASDADNPAANTLRYTASSITHGRFALTSNLATPITSFTQQQVNTGQVRFVHDGTNSAPTYRLRVSDGTANSTFSNATVYFTAVNDVPVFVTNNLSIGNGGTAVPVIVVTDEESAAGQLNISVSNLSGGMFVFNSAPTNAITSFTQLQVNNGEVSFVHDGFGVAPSYRLTVTDGGGGGNGGVGGGAASASRDVSILSFNNLNSTPVFSANLLTISEGDVVQPNIQTTDADDAASRLSITVSDLVGGYFAFNTDLTIRVTSFLQSEVNTGTLRFVHDGSNTAPSYRLTVADPSGAEATSLATVSFTPVNDPPVIMVNALSITEGGVALPLIEATDEESNPGQLSFTVSQLSGGHFELVSVDGSPISQFTQAQIDSGDVRFLHDGGVTAPSYTLTVSDGLAQSAPSTVNVSSFTLVNDKPVFTQNGLTITEGRRATPLIALSDEESTPEQLLITVSDLRGGRFELNNSFLGSRTLISEFTWGQYLAGQVSFLHDGSEVAPDYTLTVTDSEGAFDTSALKDLTFASVNDAPTFSANSLTISEGGFALPNIKVIDADNEPSQLTIFVTSANGGRFELTSLAGQALTSFTQLQLDRGLVRFVDDGGGTAPSYSLMATDPEGLSTGSRTSQVRSEGTVTFTAVNDAPVFTSNTLVISEGGTVRPSITVTDEDDSAAQLSFNVTALTGGRFELLTAPGVAITVFTQAALAAGNVQFVHDGFGAAPTYTLTVTDSLGAQSVAIRPNVNYTEVNDAPVLTANGLVITEGGTAKPSISTTDEDHSAAQRTISVTALTGGRFELLAAPGVVVTSFTQAALDAGTVQFVHDGFGDAPNYILTVTDADGAQSTSSRPIVRFTAVNDAPVFVENSLTVSEGGQATPLIRVTDEDNNAAELGFKATQLRGGRFELTSAPGVAISQFTQAQLNAGSVRFVHDGSETVPNYALSVSDVEGAQATSAGPNLSYTPVNDAPVILKNQLRITEAGFAVPNIAASDVDTPAAQLTFTVTSVSGGRFELIGTGGSSGVNILSFSQAQLNAGAVLFVHNGSLDAPTYSLSLTDGDTVITSKAAVTFTRLPPPTAALVPVISPSQNTAAANATSASTSAVSKPASASAADVLASRTAAAEASAQAAAQALAVEASANEAQARAAQTLTNNKANPSNNLIDGRDAGARAASASANASPNASANSGVGAVEVDSRWATASVATGAVNVQNLLLTGDLNGLNWGSSSSNLLDRKLLDAVLGSSDSGLRNTALDKAFERIREELDQGTQTESQAVAGSLVLSTSFSVGYVLWLARGGVLLASMASSIPAWATVDPLPVLSRYKARPGEGDDLGDGGNSGSSGSGTGGDSGGEKTDALERLFSKAKKVFTGGNDAAAAPSAAPTAAPAPAIAPVTTPTVAPTSPRTARIPADVSGVTS